MAGDLSLDLADGVERGETGSVLALIEAVSGGGGDDTITGDGAANRLDGRSGDDSIRGAGGDDTLLGGRGFNLLDGGAGQDTASYAWATDAVSVSLAAGFGEVLDPAAAPGDDPAARDDLLGIENVVGGAGNDTITGDGGANALDGAAGNDSVTGGDGDDTLFAGQGRDTLTGGAGFDTADFGGASGDFNVDLTAGVENAETNSVLAAIEAVSGGDGDDTITGDDAANRLDGRDGDDSIRGAGGDDTLLGGRGFNLLDGGDGNDTITYAWAIDAVLVSLAGGLGEVLDPAAAPGDDPLARDDLLGIENVVGSAANDTIVGNAGANRLEGAAGDDSVSGRAGKDDLSGAAGTDTLAGDQGDDTLTGGAGDDLLGGGAGFDTAVFAGRRADFEVAYVTEGFATDGFVVADARLGNGEGTDTVAGVEFFAFSDGTVPLAELLGDTPPPDPVTNPLPTIYGTTSDDRLWFQPGNEIIDGLGGRDWIDMLAEGRRYSALAAQSDGTLAVIHSAQTDAIYNTEEIRFLDGRLVMDENDPAARVTRLYEAGLNRLPDQGGLNFWIDSLQDGQSLSGLAQGFIASPEFQARFGGASSSNGAFVDQLYLNVLGRAAEQGGRDFWVSSLDRGAASRAEVLVGISESPENKAGTAALVQAGIWDRSEEAAQVARLYDTVFGRLPDTSGLMAWKTALESGSATLLQIADSFTQSAEFRGQYGNLGNRDFANALYVNTLDRPADQAGLDHWTGVLNSGVSRAEVVLAFSESAEHVALTAANIQSENPGEYGILFA